MSAKLYLHPTFMKLELKYLMILNLFSVYANVNFSMWMKSLTKVVGFLLANSSYTDIVTCEDLNFFYYKQNFKPVPYCLTTCECHAFLK